MPRNKLARLTHFVNIGKSIGYGKEWAHKDTKEIGETGISIFRWEGKYRVLIEIYFLKDYYVKENYLRDSIHDFATIEEVFAFVEQETGISYKVMHA